jgi:hypothetical protein
MFATLLGPLPRPPLPADADAADVLEAVLAVQVEHGLDPLTDGGHPVDVDPVAAWRRAAAAAEDRLVKAVVIGPLSSDRAVDAVRTTLLELAEAGCPWIEVHEPIATTIDDDTGRERFAATHAALTGGLDGVHLSLAITGGNADTLGIDALTAGAYASLAVDLIDGPDNWRLVTRWPAERGVIAGALSTRTDSDDGPELLLWAAGYAASSLGRGIARTGLATAGSLAELPWDVTVEKLRRLGEAARLVTAPREERARTIDPRAIDIRSAAHGRYAPRPRRGSGRNASTDRP